MLEIFRRWRVGYVPYSLVKVGLNLKGGLNFPLGFERDLGDCVRVWVGGEWIDLVLVWIE